MPKQVHNLIAPTVNSQDSVQGAMIEIYDEINKLMNQVFELSTQIDVGDPGKEGEIRVVLLPDLDAQGEKQYVIEGYTIDGWQQSAVLTAKRSTN